MAEFVVLISNIISLIHSIKFRVDTVEGNQERCKILEMRCNVLVKPLKLLMKEPKNIIKYNNAIHQLDIVVKKCLDYVEKMSRSSWQRICLNLAYALSISKDYDDLHKQLSTVSADLNFNISIDQKLIDQAKAIDDAKTMQSILELLEVNGQMTNDIKSSVSLQHNLLFDKLVKFESMFNDLFERTNTLLAIVNNDESNNKKSNNNDNKGKVDKKLHYNTELFDFNKLNELNLTQLEWDESYLSNRGSISSASNNDNDNIETKGVGTFGSVFACNYYGIKIALKHFNNISGNNTINKIDLLKMKREALIMQNCIHRNIISFIGCSIEKGLIAMELATCSLSDILYTNNINNNRLSFRKILSTISSNEFSISLKLKIFNDISRALRYLHYHKIIHRDIKSSNILLFITGNNIQAKVGDFGLAYTMGMTIQNTISSYNHDNENNKNSINNKAVGTIAYMAPELLDFDGDAPIYSNSVDIYGFGIIMNEVLTKQQPWYGLRDPQIISKVIVKKHRPDLFISKNVHESKLIELIGNSEKGCLAHNFDVRPTASYLATAFETIVSTYLPNDSNELEKDATSILTKTAINNQEKPIKPPKISLTNIDNSKTNKITTDLLQGNLNNTTTNSATKIYYHPGNYSFWKSNQCWDCCLATNSNVQGCQQSDNQIKHHVRRYTQDFILVNLGFGKWLCCNEKKRNSTGCQNGKMPPLFHPGFYRDWSTNSTIFDLDLDDNSHYWICCGDTISSPGCVASTNITHHPLFYDGKVWKCCNKRDKSCDGCVQGKPVNVVYHPSVIVESTSSRYYMCCKLPEIAKGCRRDSLSYHSGSYYNNKWNCCSNTIRECRGCMSGIKGKSYHTGQWIQKFSFYDCCLSNSIDNIGCRCDEKPKYHPLRFKPYNILLSSYNTMNGYWPCCNNKGRDSIGCCDLIYDKLLITIHPGFINDWSNKNSDNITSELYYQCCGDLVRSNTEGCVSGYPDTIAHHTQRYIKGSYRCCSNKFIDSKGCQIGVPIDYYHTANYFIDKHDSSLNHWVCCKIKNSKNKGCHREFNVSSHSDTYSSSILFGKKWKCCRKSKRWDIGCVVIDNKNAKLITNSDVL